MCLPFLAPLGSAIGASSTAAAIGSGTVAAGSAGSAAAVAGTITAAQMALGAYAAHSSTAAARDQTKYGAAVARNNAAMARMEAGEAERIGNLEAQRKFREVAAMRKGQQAAASASGVDASAGSTGDVIKATDYFGRIDANTIATNAGKQAWGKRVEAGNYASSARMQGAAAGGYNTGLSVGVSLLTGGGNVADKWVSRTVKG